MGESDGLPRRPLDLLLLTRRIARDAAIATVLGLLAVAATVILDGGRRYLDGVAADSASAAVAALGARRRDLVSSVSLPWGGGTTPVAEAADAALNTLDEQVVPALSPLARPAVWVQASNLPGPYGILDPPPQANRSHLIGFAVSTRWRQQLTLLSGQWPTTGVTPQQVLLSDVAARRMHLPTGSRFTVGTQPMVIAGTVAAANPDDPILAVHPEFVDGSQHLDPQGNVIETGVLLADPGDAERMAKVVPLNANLEFRIPISANPDLRGVSLSELIAKIRTVKATDRGPELRMTTGLDGVLAQQDAANAPLHAISRLLRLQAVLLTMAVLILAVALLAGRRPREWRTLSARGVSAQRQRLWRTAQIALIVTPPAAVGVIAVSLFTGAGHISDRIAGLIDGGPSTRSAVGAVTVCLLLALGTAWLAPIPGAAHDSPQRRRVWLRARVVLELVASIAAGAAVVALRSRGLRPDDLLTLLAPMAVLAAGALLALRVRDLLVLLGHHRARRGTTLPRFVAAARARFAPGHQGAMATLVLALAMATQSVVVASSIDATATLAAARTVGAPTRVMAPFITAAQLRAISAAQEGTAVAAMSVQRGVVVRPETGPSLTVQLVVADPAEVALVQRDIPDGLPASAAEQLQARPAPGAARAQVPVLVSPGVAAPGTHLTMPVAGRVLSAVVVGVREWLPGTSAEQPWVLMPREPLREAIGTSPQNRVLLFSVGLDAQRLRPVLGTSFDVLTPGSHRESLRRTPWVRAVLGSLPWITALAATLATLALWLTMLATAPGRARSLGPLRALGLSRSQAARITFAEFTPTLLVAGVLGPLLGFAVAALLLRASDLSALIGVRQPIILTAPAGMIALVVLAVLAGAGLAVGALAWHRPGAGTEER